VTPDAAVMGDVAFDAVQTFLLNTLFFESFPEWQFTFQASDVPSCGGAKRKELGRECGGFYPQWW
jgi:hypothetical protein